MNKLKESRAASFAVVAIVYILATVAGVLVYRALTLDWWLSLLLADVAATVFTFIFSILFGNASVYDPYWSVQPPVILIAFALGSELTALGVLLLAADTLSRSIGSGAALPVGAITSLLGAPFFLAIIFLGRGHADDA